MTSETPETFRREVAVTFAENGDGRTLQARLIPYGEVGEVSDDGMRSYRERFVAGSFNAQLRAPHRIKAFLNFRHRQGLEDQIGHATKIEDRADGLHGELRILDTPAGDAALKFVEAGMLNRISIEFASVKHRIVDRKSVV